MISNMHVRWDWKELNDHDNYKRIKTLCGINTVRHMAGIPAVTNQPVKIDTPRGWRWGWCTRCMRNMAHHFAYNPVDQMNLHPYVQAVHEEVSDFVAEFSETVRKL